MDVAADEYDDGGNVLPGRLLCTNTLIFLVLHSGDF